MKKNIAVFFAMLIFISPVFSGNDKLSEDYLKSKKHIAMINPLAESFVERAVKQSLKKEAPGKYKVKFTGHTLSSMKKGIFKYLEITGKDVTTKDITIPYFNMKTITDYNWIEYDKHPIVYKSDITFDCVAEFDEKSINQALETEEYNKILRNINRKVYPLFFINEVMVKIKNDKLHIIMTYNFPLAPRKKDRTFMVTSGLKVVNYEIKTYDVEFDSAYGNLPLDKVANLVNLLNPLNFTVKLVDSKHADAKIEQIEIKDDIVTVSGKIYIKGDNK